VGLSHEMAGFLEHDLRLSWTRSSVGMNACVRLIDRRPTGIRGRRVGLLLISYVPAGRQPPRCHIKAAPLRIVTPPAIAISLAAEAMFPAGTPLRPCRLPFTCFSAVFAVPM